MTDDLRPEYNLAELLKGGVKGKYVEAYRRGYVVIVHATENATDQSDTASPENIDDTLIGPVFVDRTDLLDPITPAQQRSHG